MDAILAGDVSAVETAGKEAIDVGISPDVILEKGGSRSLDIVGEKFDNLEMFLPEMLAASEAMKALYKMLVPLLNTESNPAIAIILNPSELKTNYSSFHKTIHAIGCNGYLDCGGSYAMIGGFSGSPERCVLTNVATDLLMFTILQSDVAAIAIYDMRFDSSCGRHALWANSIATQTEARNTHMMLYKLINQLAGPSTKEILYTSAAGTIATAVSGVAFQIGPRTAGGRFKNYLKPLEHWFMTEVFESSAGLTLSKANEIVSYLLSTYESGLKDPPEGETFTECFDLKTLTPDKEWMGIVDKAADDFRAYGFEMDD